MTIHDGLDALSHAYVALAYRIDRLAPGVVDAYTGPEGVRMAAQAGPDPMPEALVDEAGALLRSIADAALPVARQRYLTAQVAALRITAQRLAGVDIPYAGEVEGLFGISSAPVPESVFEGAIEALDGLLPGSGPINGRMTAWRDQFVVPTDTARILIDLIVAETRARTLVIVDLPEAEGFDIAYVSNQPWSGYNWYLGKGRSRVDINTDLPIRANDLTSLVAHEGYPGHHCEHTVKEQSLYRTHGYGEHAIQLINTPQCVISEGIATLASNIVFPGDELARFHADVVFPAAGIEVDAGQDLAIAEAQRALRGVNANAAWLRHGEGASDDTAAAYIERYALKRPDESRQSLRFINDPLWRAYVYTYHAGRDLLAGWLDQAATEADRVARFRRLLTEQVAPSDVTGWIATG